MLRNTVPLMYGGALHVRVPQPIERHRYWEEDLGLILRVPAVGILGLSIIGIAAPVLDQTNYRKSIGQVLTLLQVLNCDVDLVVRKKTA